MTVEVDKIILESDFEIHLGKIIDTNFDQNTGIVNLQNPSAPKKPTKKKPITEKKPVKKKKEAAAISAFHKTVNRYKAKRAAGPTIY